MSGRARGVLLEEAAGILRIAAILWMVLGGIYTAALSGFGRIAAPASARGSLIRNSEGAVVGSRWIAQKFSQPHYFWPRPSAVDYDGSAAGGSNLPPSSAELALLVKKRIAALGGTPDHPVPAELLAASGSGLDPDLTPAAVDFQTGRVAAARGLDPVGLRGWVRNQTRVRRAARRSVPLINILQLNIALDERFGPPRAADGSGREEDR